MSIKRFMAPAMNVPETCTNCTHRHEHSTFKRCILCRDQATGEKPFPLHQVDDIEAPL